MSPRKILYIVILAAVLAAVFIAVSGPFGISDDGTAGDPVTDPNPSEAAAAESNAPAMIEEFEVNDDLFSVAVNGKTVTLSCSHSVSDSFLVDFFAREESKYGLRNADISYTFPESGKVVIEFPEIATPRRISRWLEIWMDDLKEFSAK